MKNKNIINIIKKYKIQYLVGVIFLIISSYLINKPAQIIGNIIDVLYKEQTNNNLIFSYVKILLVIAIFSLIVRFIWKAVLVRAIRRSEKDMKDALLEHIINMPTKELINRSNGEFMSYFVKDIHDIRKFLYRLFGLGTRVVFRIIIAIYSMIVYVDLKLTIFVMLPIILTIFLSTIINKNYIKSLRKSREAFTNLSYYVQEATDGIRTIKAYAQEDEEIKNFEKINNNYKNSNFSLTIYSALLYTCITLCFGISYAISIIMGSKLILDGVITVGAFTAFNTYIALLVSPVSWIPEIITAWQRSKVGYARLSNVFNVKVEKIDTKLIEKEAENNIKGDIDIKNLNFTYSQNLYRTINNFSLEVKKGETVGIIGKVGSGKTTLMNLLLRLYEVERGKIYIDGKDINDIPIENLRENISYITQDNFLFSSTIRDNINLFRHDYDDREIEESARKSLIYDKILELEDGFDSVIGERGVDLSGGQKQRTAISRAFLKKSKIVIFDDTFCALDSKTGRNLLKNIKEFAKDKTCIIVSNRILDVKELDKILVLDAGEIIELGTHKELIKQKGQYYKFYVQQLLEKEAAI